MFKGLVAGFLSNPLVCRNSHSKKHILVNESKHCQQCILCRVSLRTGFHPTGVALATTSHNSLLVSTEDSVWQWEALPYGLQRRVWLWISGRLLPLGAHTGDGQPVSLWMAVVLYIEGFCVEKTWKNITGPGAARKLQKTIFGQIKTVSSIGEKHILYDIYWYFMNRLKIHYTHPRDFGLARTDCFVANMSWCDFWSLRLGGVLRSCIADRASGGHSPLIYIQSKWACHLSVGQDVLFIYSLFSWIFWHKNSCQFKSKP